MVSRILIDKLPIKTVMAWRIPIRENESQRSVPHQFDSVADNPVLRFLKRFLIGRQVFAREGHNPFASGSFEIVPFSLA